MTEMGVRYQPGAQDQSNGVRREGNGGPTSTVPQQAIRTLSLRVPQTTSVPGIAPLPLLNATGGGGTDLDMLLHALLKAFGPEAMRGASGPSPRGVASASLTSPARTTPRMPRILPMTPPSDDDTLYPSPVVEPPPSESGSVSAPVAPRPNPPSWLANKYALPNALTPLF